MKKIIICMTIIFSLIHISLQVATAEETEEKAADKVEKVRIQEVFGTRQIMDWQVIDNKNIIIDTFANGKFKATFTRSCNYIPFTETIGFMTQGPYALDENTTIILSNGEQCVIQELVSYVEEDKDIKESYNYSQ